MGNAKSCAGWRKRDIPETYSAVVLQEEGHHMHDSQKSVEFTSTTGPLAFVALVVQGVFIVCLCNAQYTLSAHTPFSYSVATDLYAGMALILLVGFGYMRVFLKFYGLGAVGFNLLVVAIGLQWASLLEGWMRHRGFQIDLDIACLLRSTLAVAAVLVSFGTLVGKVSPLQVLLLTMVELPCVLANKFVFLGSGGLQPFVDTGGTVAIHLFGAAFGLAASLAYGPAGIRDKDRGLSLELDMGLSSSYLADVLSLLGTLTFWTFFPCVAAASLPMGSAVQRLAIMNTIFALLGSTATVFACGTLPSQRLHVVPVREATLAGGVAIGAVSGVVGLGPGVSLLIGATAGCLSSAATLAHTFAGHYDSCRVAAVYGVPALFGGFVSAALPLMLHTEPPALQWQHQLLGMAGTVAIAGIAGALTGGLLRLLPRPLPALSDEAFWQMGNR